LHFLINHFLGRTAGNQETEIAKNYLDEKELEILNRTVTAYLELAELQTLNRKPMYMKDWIARLDQFLTMTVNEIFNHAGTVSHKQAIQKASEEYIKYKALANNDISRVAQDFIKQIDATTNKLKGKIGR
jgi:hypothetical protein